MTGKRNNTGINNPMFGQRHSKETKEKMSKAWENRDKEAYRKRMSEMSKNQIGEKNSMYGKYHTEESKEKMSGKNNGNWQGGERSIDYKGYVIIWTPKGRKKEHRYVMEQHLKRNLTKKEVVHHINGIVDDNRIENLRLFESGSEHSKFHKTTRGEVITNGKIKY